MTTQLFRATLSSALASTRGRPNVTAREAKKIVKAGAGVSPRVQVSALEKALKRPNVTFDKGARAVLVRAAKAAARQAAQPQPVPKGPTMSRSDMAYYARVDADIVARHTGGGRSNAAAFLSGFSGGGQQNAASYLSGYGSSGYSGRGPSGYGANPAAYLAGSSGGGRSNAASFLSGY